MSTREVCRAIIYDDTYRILLAQRARGMGEGQWALVGGKPDLGEKPKQTVKREVKEELGLNFTPKLFKEELDDSIDAKGQSWRVWYFSGPAVGQLTLQEENQAAKYFELTEITNLDVAFGHLRIIQEFLATITSRVT